MRADNAFRHNVPRAIKEFCGVAGQKLALFQVEEYRKSEKNGKSTGTGECLGDKSSPTKAST